MIDKRNIVTFCIERCHFLILDSGYMYIDCAFPSFELALCASVGYSLQSTVPNPISNNGLCSAEYETRAIVYHSWCDTDVDVHYLSQGAGLCPRPVGLSDRYFMHGQPN